MVEQHAHCFDDFAHLEGLALDLVQPACVDEELVAQDRAQLAAVQLRDHHAPVAAQQLADVRLQRVEIPQVQMADGSALRAELQRGLAQRAVRAAPADDQHVARRLALDFGGRQAVGDLVDLGLTREHHVLVVLRVVGDVPGDVFLLDPADPVLDAGGSRDRPRTHQPLVAQERREIFGVGAEHGVDRLEVLEVGQVPRLGAVRERAVGQVRDGAHVLDREPHRFDRDVEALRRGGRRDDRDRGLAVAADDGLQEVGRNSQAVKDLSVLRLLNKLNDLALIIGMHDPETRRRRAVHRNGAHGYIRIRLEVLAHDLAIVHPVKLVAAQNDIVIDRTFEEIPKVLPDGVGCSLIPLRSLGRLLRRKNFDETRSKIVELEAGVYMPVQRHAVELGEHIDAPDA
jgi:hypothetical protein